MSIPLANVEQDEHNVLVALKTEFGPIGIALGVMIGSIGGLLLLIMMGLTAFDVAGRYLLSAPIRGASELTGLLLCAIIFIGLVPVSMQNSHVTVDLLTDRFPQQVKPLRMFLTGLLSGVVLCVVGWRIFIYAGQIASYGGTTTSLAIPIAPLGYFCAGCAVVAGIISGLLPFLQLRHKV